VHLASSLNPAVEDVSFCPRCGRSADVDFPQRITCRHCGYGAYYNPKPVAGVIPIAEDGRIVLLRRGFEPGKGKWTFPGGFVDLGESVEEAACREMREELEIGVELRRLVGVYSRPDDRVILIVFKGTITEQPHTTPEAVEVEAFTQDSIPWHELAFWSTEPALKACVGQA
jgi:ADP-ribose pyrophosphatase YjhB (NUDIX family)